MSDNIFAENPFEALVLQGGNLYSVISVDIDTTGLDPKQDEIIEIAAVKYIHGEKTDVFQTFVHPKQKIPQFIQLLTHIKPEDIAGAPDIKSVLPGFCTFIKDSILVGQNLGFDLGFINYALVNQGKLTLNNLWYDTAEIARIYIPYIHDHKLKSLAEYFGISLENAHRAIDDAIATGEVFYHLVDYIVSHFPLMINARLLDLSRQAMVESALTSFLQEIVEHQRRMALTADKIQLPVNNLTNILEIKTGTMEPITLEQVFSPTGILADRFGNYEFRAGQLDMAQQVDQALTHSNYLLVEAGTGVGKSFAYLVPALQFAYRHQKKIIVSTNTKNLQEQLFYKDLPQLAEMLPIPFKALLMKGRENYLCKRRWEELMQEQVRGITPYEAHGLLYLFVWKQLSHTGDITENSSFDKNRFSIVWRKICSDRYFCHKQKCHFYSSCYLMNLRRQSDSASVVVANHSLLISDLQAENISLGNYEHLIIDEAHNLAPTAAEQLGMELSYAELVNLLNHLGSSQKRKRTGFLQNIQSAIEKSLLEALQKEHITHLLNRLQDDIDKLRPAITELFNEAARICPEQENYGKLRINDPQQLPRLFELMGELAMQWKDFLKDLSALTNVFSTLNSQLTMNYDILSDTLSGLSTRSVEAETILLTLLAPDLEDYAMWLESPQRNDRSNPSTVICYAPIEVNQHLNNIIYSKLPSVIFTSATLALRDSFKYFETQTGLNLVQERQIDKKVVESPFDYPSQTELIVTSFLPPHTDRFFMPQAMSCLRQILTITNVGTMILFTSYKDLNIAYNELSDVLYQQDRPLFAQGKGRSRDSILNEFKRNGNAVLLGTSSFWEGVDVQGDSLSLLILFKLPFQVPSDPIVEAYIDKLDKQNKNSFLHFMLPNALLRLRQGFGRLIRSRRDTGVVIIMDSRVTSKDYGKYFKQVLPAKCLELQDELSLLNSITQFFNR